MLRCPRRMGCGFYPNTPASLRERFCNTPNHPDCARYQTGCEGKPVPETLRPTGRHATPRQEPVETPEAADETPCYF